MRYDDFRRSDDIDDRRDDSGGGMGGGGGFGLPMGGGGLGIGTIIVLGLVGYAFGIDPRILIGGAEILTGGNQAPTYQTDRRSGPAKTGAPKDEMGSMIAGILGEIDDRWSEIFQASGQNLHRAAHRAVPQRHQWRPLRHGAVGDGAVLLPAGQADLPRHQFLPRGRDALPAAARAMPASSRRPISSRMKPGHHIQNLLGILPRVTAAAAAGRQQGGSQRAAGQGRTAGGLPVRRLGQPRGEEASGLPRSRRYRRGADDGDRDRRRHAAAAGDGQGGAGQLHPRLRGAAQAMVHDRLPAGHGAGLQHVCAGRVVVEGIVPSCWAARSACAVVPAIHVYTSREFEDVDARHKRRA